MVNKSTLSQFLKSQLFSHLTQSKLTFESFLEGDGHREQCFATNSQKSARNSCGYSEFSRKLPFENLWQSAAF